MTNEIPSQEMRVFKNESHNGGQPILSQQMVSNMKLSLLRCMYSRCQPGVYDVSKEEYLLGIAFIRT